MSLQKKNRVAFRPTLGEASLEDRVVLSSTAAVGGHIAAAAQTGNMTVKQLIAGYAAQNRAAYSNLNQTIRQEVSQLYSNGKPTSQQLSDFNATLAGQIDAQAYRLASQEALLPNSAKRLVPNLQGSLLSNNKGSLLSRIQALTASGNMTRSASRLQNALTNQISTAFTNNRAQLGNYLNTTNFARASVDQNGNPIPLQQYLGQQIVNQFGSTLSGLSQGFMNAANSTLFANGVTNPSQNALQGFQSQYGAGLNLAAFQLGNNLNLLNGASTTLLPQLQSGIFGSTNTTGNGTGANSFNGLFPSLQGLPFNDPTANFTMGLNNAFSSGFSNVSSSIGSFLNMPTQANPTLPSFSNILSPTFTNSNFFGGFNSGYGSGFPGFGTAPSTVNSNFGTGFNNFVNTTNTNLGFNVPNFGTLPGSTTVGLNGGNIPA